MLCKMLIGNVEILLREFFFLSKSSVSDSLGAIGGLRISYKALSNSVYI